LNKIVNGENILLLNNSFARGHETKPDLPDLDQSRFSYRNFRISKKLLRPLWNSIGLPRLEHLIGNFDVYHAPTHNVLPLTNAKKILTIHDLSHKKGISKMTHSLRSLIDIFRKPPNGRTPLSQIPNQHELM